MFSLEKALHLSFIWEICFLYIKVTFQILLSLIIQSKLNAWVCDTSSEILSKLLSDMLMKLCTIWKISVLDDFIGLFKIEGF